ncbi:MAG: nucleotidyltransferase family protein [Leptolyngbyaceae cyanobacterium CRU_2_3]|nr:nucleotidyltransferase family protein [Leptolyngbyaceae cyanobacterium CRU_2_3]
MISQIARSSKLELPRTLVLAAGKSTKNQPVSGGFPKPLLSIQGRTTLERNLSWLSQSGLDSVWVVLADDSKEIQTIIGDGSHVGLKVLYSPEPEILGTAGAYKKLESHWQGVTLVVCGDSLVRFDLEKFLLAHKNPNADITIALLDQNTHLHTAIAADRVVMDDLGRITDFVQTISSTTLCSTLVDAGVYLIEPEILDLIPPQTSYDFAQDLFPRMLAEGYYLQGHLIDGYCLGLDSPECYAKAMSFIDSKQIKLS